MSKVTHLNTVPDIIAAWNSGKPLAGMCGAVRVTTPEKHDKILRKGNYTPCPDCLRIVSAFLSTGQARSVHMGLTSDEILRQAVPLGSYYYTITIGSNTSGTTSVRTAIFPEAV